MFLLSPANGGGARGRRLLIRGTGAIAERLRSRAGIPLGELYAYVSGFAAHVDGCEVVLLGSIASPKYVDVRLEVFGARLHFPSAFVGRGHLSRGGLLLRQVALGRELDYVPVQGAVRRGARPLRLGTSPPAVS